MVEEAVVCRQEAEEVVVIGIVKAVKSTISATEPVVLSVPSQNQKELEAVIQEAVVEDVEALVAEVAEEENGSVLAVKLIISATERAALNALSQNQKELENQLEEILVHQEVVIGSVVVAKPTILEVVPAVSNAQNQNLKELVVVVVVIQDHLVVNGFVQAARKRIFHEELNVLNAQNQNQLVLVISSLMINLKSFIFHPNHQLMRMKYSALVSHLE